MKEIYLTKSNALVDHCSKEEVVYKASYESSEYYGNHTDTIRFTERIGEAMLNGWELLSFRTHHKWHYTLDWGLCAKKNGKNSITLKFKDTVYNWEGDFMEINSKLIQKHLVFLKSIPECIYSQDAINLMSELSDCSDKESIIKFYKNFSKLRKQLDDKEIDELDKQFVHRMNILL